MEKEIEFKIVKKWIYKGKLCVITQNIWEPYVKTISSSLHDWYNGYVETILAKDYDDLNINVHGGLTFGGELGFEELKGKRFYGFDTAHAFDDNPNIQNLDYVTKETEQLADQIIELEKAG